MKTTTLTIVGMHCASCKALLEDVCNDLAGVVSCDANVAGGTLTIEHEESIDLATLQREIEGLGKYKAQGYNTV